MSGKRRKVVLASNTSWNIYNFRLGLVDALEKKGYEVSIWAPLDAYTRHLTDRGLDVQPAHINLKGSNPITELRLIWTYWKLIRRHKPDVILTFTIKPTLYLNLASKFSRVKVLSNITGLGTLFIKPSFSTWIAMRLYKSALKSCTKVFFQNESDYRFFRLKRIISSGQAEQIPGSGINFEKFNIEKRGVDVNEIKFLFVGRLLKDKGIIEYLEAAKKIIHTHTNVKFYIVGQLGYDNATSISQQVLNSYLSPGKIEYMGQSDQIKVVYRDMDIMVLPSYREGLSRSLLEAGAMKMPLITTNVPGCRELVCNSKNGFLVSARKVDALVTAFNKILSLSEEEILRMGEESRKCIEENFSERIVIDKYIKEITNT